MISIDRARRLLGKTANKMSNDEVQKLVRHSYQLISRLLDNFVETKYGRR